MPLCPKDRRLNYNIKFCRSQFKNTIRPWCKECKHSIPPKKKKGKKKK